MFSTSHWRVATNENVKDQIISFRCGHQSVWLFFSTAMGDLLTQNTKQFHVPSNNETHWLFPWLKSTSPGYVGTKIGRMLKACHSTQHERTKLRVTKSLTSDVTTQGIRKGAVNQLAASMPGEFAVAATGHDMTQTSKFYEYMQPRVAMLQPAANVLSGWPAPPFGQLGHGPRAPSLDALSSEDRTNVHKMIMTLWVNERFPHYVQPDGDLWPMLTCSMAALIMYYEKRRVAGEMYPVLKSMRSAWSEVTKPGNSRSSSLMGAVHHKLVNMGMQIEARFKADNIHITGTDRLNGVQKIIDVVQSLSKVVEMQTKKLDKLYALHSEMVVNLSNVHKAVQTPEKYKSVSSKSNDEPPIAPIPVTQRLVPSSKTTVTSLSKRFDTAAEYYLECVLNGIPKLIKHNRNRSRLINHWFKCMSTDQEHELFSSQDPEDKLKQHDLVLKLSKLVRARLRDVFEKNDIKVPIHLLKKKVSNRGTYRYLTTSSIENHLRKMKKMKLDIPVVTRESFQQWRGEYENIDLSKDV